MSDSDEWRAAVSVMTEMERAVTRDSGRQALGMCGDPEDALYE